MTGMIGAVASMIIAAVDISVGAIDTYVQIRKIRDHEECWMMAVSLVLGVPFGIGAS